MVAILIAEIRILNLVAVGELLLQLRHIFLLGAVELRGCKSILLHALGLAIDGCQRLQILTLLGNAVKREGILGLRQHILSVVGSGLHKRAVGFLYGLLHAHSEHHPDERLAVVADQIVQSYLLLRFHGVVLHHQIDQTVLHLLVLLYGIDGLGIVGHGLVHHLCGIGIHLTVFPEFLDHLFAVIHIHVAYDDDSLIVWAIPFMIVVAQHLRIAAVNHAHQSDGQAHAIFTAGVQARKDFVAYALEGAFAQLPFLMDDTALLLYLLTLQCQTVRPVFQHEDTRIEGTDALRGHVADAIHGLVDRGVGIQVASEIHADASGKVEQG